MYIWVRREPEKDYRRVEGIRKSIVCIVIVLLIGCVLYFKPLRLSDK